MDIILKYFPNLTAEQTEQFRLLGQLYPEWNEKINVISRKDIDNLYTNHILHSLAIAKFTDFKAGSSILDLGTGGGLPGIPLAIMFPDTNFLMVDRTGKKIKVASSIADAIGLKNAEFSQCDAKEIKEKFDFVVSRAVMELPDLIALIRKNIKKECINSIPNGLICLKGGNLTGEKQKAGRQVIEEDLSSYFEEEFFKTKKIIYTSL